MIKQDCVNHSSATMQVESPKNRPAKRVRMEREKYVCGLCFRKMDAFSDPRLVNCLHSICSKCADNLVQGSQCNLCQTVIEPQKVKPDLFFHKTVLHQCDNTQMIQSSFGDTKNNPFNGQIKLTSSAPGNDAVKCACCCDFATASLHCHHCNGPICDSCHNDHGMMKELKWHKIEKRNLAREVSFEALKPHTHCKEHLEEYDRFCEECSALMCHECQNHIGHLTKMLSDKSCSLNQKTKSTFHEILSTVKSKESMVESVLDSYCSSLASITQMQERQQTLINCFQTEMKQFVDEVTKNASEKLKVNFEYRRDQLLKEREKLQLIQRKISHQSEFLEDIMEQNFTIGMHTATKFMISRVEEQMKQIPPDMKSLDPANQIITIPEYFDGKLIAENFFTFLRTHGKTDELIRSFRHHIHDRFNPSNCSVSPIRPPLLRAAHSVEIESPDKRCTAEIFSKPPVQILLHDCHNYSTTDPRLKTRKSHPIPEDVSTGPPKHDKIPRIDSRVNHKKNSISLVTCCICLAQTNPQGGHVCGRCSSFYHSTCHTPTIQKSCPTWTCAKCQTYRFSAAIKLNEGALNPIQKLICARIIVSVIVKLNTLSVKSPFGTACSTDFNHIKAKLFPSEGRCVAYGTIFDFYTDIRNVLDGYHRFYQSTTGGQQAKRSMSDIDYFVHEMFELEFKNFHEAFQTSRTARTAPVHNRSPNNIPRHMLRIE